LPPRNPNKAFRLPSIAAKMANITGLDGSEKALMVRIGNLIDAFTVQQRNINNPGETGPRVLSNRVPKVSNLSLTIIGGGVDAIWDAISFSNFETYEVEYAENTTFVGSTLLTAPTNKISIKGLPSDTSVAVRVRVVDRIGRVGLWTSSETTPIGTIPLFSVDGDSADFENRTVVFPSPELFGGASSADSLVNAITGVGGAVGPSPVTFYDGSDGGRLGKINQISYALIENESIVSQLGVMGLPTLFYEFGDTTVDSNGRHYMSFPGSFVDFFAAEELDFDPSVVGIVFLGYTETPHEQAGIVQNATMGTIKL